MKPAVVPVTDLVLSQEQVQSPVDAVMVLVLLTSIRRPLGMMRRQVTCDVCHGRGKEIKDPCTTCHGTGHEKQAHSVHVKIPAGVEPGQQIRLAGQGEAALMVDLTGLVRGGFC